MFKNDISLKSNILNVAGTMSDQSSEIPQKIAVKVMRKKIELWTIKILIKMFCH